MTDIALIIIFWSGMCAVGVFAYHLGRARGQREGMKIDVKVDQALQDRINAQVVNAWLDQHGLCWMPKGVERAMKDAKR